MALDTQINLYSCDTSHFYSNRETYLHNMNYKYRHERNAVKQHYIECGKQLIAKGYNQADLTAFENGRIDDMVLIPDTSKLLYQYLKCVKLLRHKRCKIGESKSLLLKLLQNKVQQNELTNGKDHTRVLNATKLHDTNVISIFESDLTRTLSIQKDSLSTALVIVQIYYFDVFKDIEQFGFLLNGEKYRYYSSSAGQIRKKKAVFIKESLWNEHEKTIMCGLTIDKINAKGGNNVNKHLAYLALSNSATDTWDKFDIDRCIVIDDFETLVEGKYDLIDDIDYSITRKEGSIPITHTDGAGMMLPSVQTKNTMFRAPWIKGLLGVFDFVEFIKEHNCSPLVKDIYGIEHDVISENINIIFTKSQFKMHKYYSSWDEYKTYFKQYHCAAGVCNAEEDRFKFAKINYQMLQTLTDINEAEIRALAQKSIEKITHLCDTKEHALETLGVTPYNTKMTHFQQALRIYPALLNDTYVKDTIRSIKDSLLKKYRSGKLEVNGKYTFILPDFYAACEHWFCKIDNPAGLLKDKEVFCRLFKHNNKLDCLRSPHLYKEHAIRFNTACTSDIDRRNKLNKWFTTNALYISVHDFISKILQLDVDGDKSLVVADPFFIKIAERNMHGILPLYYNMKKASPTVLNAKTIYNGLITAFVGGNIGIYSNNISKIWNSDVFITGTEEEQQEAIDLVKILCMENNFVIDYAKTLYKPTRPIGINDKVSKFTKAKLPAFFEFAKDKTPQQVAHRNKSLVNTLYTIIPNKAISMRGLKLEKLDYHKLMHDPLVVCDSRISQLYDELNKKYRYKFNLTDDKISNFRYIECEIRKAFTTIGFSEQQVADMLVKYCYGNNIRHKSLLWFCFGGCIVKNLKRNIGEPKTKVVQCCTCGEWFEISIKNNRKTRCDKCQKEYRLQYDKRRKSKCDTT